MQRLHVAKKLNHALEHSLQFVAADLDQHRSAVRALRGEIDLIQIAEQSPHLVHFEHAIGADHAVTSDRRETVFEMLAQFARGIDFGKIGDHLTHNLTVIALG